MGPASPGTSSSRTRSRDRSVVFHKHPEHRHTAGGRMVVQDDLKLALGRVGYRGPDADTGSRLTGRQGRRVRKDGEAGDGGVAVGRQALAPRRSGGTGPV